MSLAETGYCRAVTQPHWWWASMVVGHAFKTKAFNHSTRPVLVGQLEFSMKSPPQNGFHSKSVI